MKGLTFSARATICSRISRGSLLCRTIPWSSLRNRPDLQVHEATQQKHQKHAASQRLARQVTRTSVLAAVQ